jgi:hypothetical protein
LELVGAPVLKLKVKSNRPVAFLVARLCDVRPDGASSRISYGILNLCHCDSHAAPEALVPGRWYDVRLQLDDFASSLPAGHRLRLGLSTGYWPMVWPSPEPAMLSIETGTSVLELPLRPPRADDAKLRPFEPPITAPGSTHKKLRHLPLRRTIEIDLASNEMVYTLRGDGGELGGAALARIEEIGLDIGYTLTKRYRIIEDDALSAATELAQSATLRRGDWSVRLECRTRLTATAETFQFSGTVQAFEGSEPFTARDWTLAIPRKLL